MITVIQKIRAGGFAVFDQGGQLSVSPASKLSAQQREFILKRKPTILIELREESTRRAIADLNQWPVSVSVLVDDMSREEFESFLGQPPETQQQIVSAAASRVTRDSWFTPSQQNQVEAWLDFIHEYEPESRREVLDKCRSDPSARRYFLGRSKEVLAGDMTQARSYQRLQPCGRCQHLKRSSVNPAGGLASCAIRPELAPAMPSLQRECGQFTPALPQG